MMFNTIELLQEDSQTIKIGDFIVSIMHNDIGFSFDVYKEEELIEEIPFYFEDLDESYEQIKKNTDNDRF